MPRLLAVTAALVAGSIVIASALAAGCTGTSTNRPDAPTFDAAPDAPIPDGIAVTITSPLDHATILGDRTITVTGTFAAAAHVVAASVEVGSAVVAPTFTDTTFSATFPLSDQANTITVIARDAYNGAGSATIAVTYPFVTLPDFTPASLVFGQTTSSVGSSRTVDAAATANPVGNAVEIAGTLYIPSIGNNRIMGFATFPIADNTNADFVLGQTSLAIATAGSGSNGMSQPSGVTTDGTHLFVSDHANNRVLAWNAVPTALDTAPDFVLGQTSFATNTSACTAAAMKAPLGIIATADKLVVVDTNNDRVLIWSTIPTATDTAPDLVLGQGDFTHCQANDDNQDGTKDATPSARTMSGPIGVWTDGTQLFVADSSNNRVLVWTTFPTASFQPADAVLGQTAFTLATLGTTSTTFSSPQMLTSNGNQLVVTDTNNNRVLLWDAMPATSIAADHVLGQGDFTHGTANDDNQDGTKDAAPSARTLSAPRGVQLVGANLLVSDASNNRVLVYP